MKSFSIPVWCMMSGLALATTAQANDAMKHGSAEAEVKMMDTDHDGSISASEHAAGAKKMFDKMDADRDGIVTAQEMEAAHKDMPTGRADAPQAGASESNPGQATRLGKSDTHHGMKTAAEKIKMIDANGDGKLSAAEHEAGARKMFDKMDTDQDGKLSAAELQAGHDRMMTADDQ